MYYDYSEPLSKVASHRILAMNRGEKEDILKVSFDLDERRIHDYLEKQLIEQPQSTAAPFITAA